jgi:ribonuclease J
MSALYRLAFSEHNQVRIASSDVVILSSSAIPGNEKLVGRIINALVRNGVRVVHESSEDLHVSGHACREEIKLLMALLKPKYLMPIHGEYRHLYANKDIGEFMGISSDKIFISDIGKVLEIDKKTAKFSGEVVPSGNVLVDGAGVGDIGSVVLRDRKHLAEDGLVVVVATVDDYNEIVSGPDVVSRGFVYVKESEELMQRVKDVAAQAIIKALSKKVRDWAAIKGTVRDDVAKFIFKETKRRPMVLPMVTEV